MRDLEVEFDTALAMSFMNCPCDTCHMKKKCRWMDGTTLAPNLMSLPLGVFLPTSGHIFLISVSACQTCEKN